MAITLYGKAAFFIILFLKIESTVHLSILEIDFPKLTSPLPSVTGDKR